MKTLTFTPRLRMIGLILTALTMLIFCFGAAFGQERDSVVAGVSADTVQPKLTPAQAKRLYAQNHLITNSDTINVYVLRVIDGDTFVAVTCLDCEDAISIRVLGIDTPESGNFAPHKVQKQMEDFGLTKAELLEAGRIVKMEARRMLEGKQVKLIRDRREQNIDKHARPLRHVILPDGTSYAKWIKAKGYNAGKE